MKAIWIFYLIELLLLTLFKPLIKNPEAVGVVVVLVHIIFTTIILYTAKKNIREPFLIGFLLRAFTLFWDLYARDILQLPNSGADTESYYNNSVTISKNLSMLGNTRGGIYSDINGIMFSLVGPQRIVLQYLNVLLGITTIYFVLKALSLLEIDEKNVRLTAFLIAFYPNAIIFSSIFLREIFSTFFMSASIYAFIKWFKSYKNKYIFISFTFLAVASVFHSGVLGVIVGYIYAFLFYQHESKTFKFSMQTIISFIILLFMFYFSFNVIDDLIFQKFAGLESARDIFDIATPRGQGGSAYLNRLQVNSFSTFLLYSPVKSIYLLISPVPWNWRGITDIFTFFFDSLLYGFIIFNYFKYRKSMQDNKALALIVFWMILGGIFIFGVGVSNAGTAMRHRHKLMPLFIIMNSLILHDIKINKENSKIINCQS